MPTHAHAHAHSYADNQTPNYMPAAGPWRAHLEGEADAARVLAQALHVGLARAAHERAAHHARLQQRRRLVLMDVLQRLQAHLHPPRAPALSAFSPARMSATQRCSPRALPAKQHWPWQRMLIKPDI